MSTTPLTGNYAGPLTHQEHMCNGKPGHKTKVNLGTMVWLSPETEETPEEFYTWDTLYPYHCGGPLAFSTVDFQFSEWIVSVSPVYVGFKLLRSVSECSHAAFLPVFVVSKDYVWYVLDSLTFRMFSSPCSIELPQQTKANEWKSW